MLMFSVIIPVYNSEKTIEKSLKSVFDQTIQDFEIIVVNDGSTDHSLDVLNKYKSCHSNMTIINQKNAGPGAARNKGIKNAKGEYIAFLDADDYWSEDFLEVVLAASNNRTADYIYIEMVKENINGKVVGKTNVARNKDLSKQQMICRQMTGKMPWGMSKVIKREIIGKCGGKFMELTVGEENIFSFEALKASKNIAFTDKVIYHYLQTEDGQHKKGDFDPWNSLVNSFKQYLINNGEFDEYESTINSLALKAMTISFYRYSNSCNFFEAKNKIKKIYNEYRMKYDFSNLNVDALDKTTILIKNLAVLKLIGVIILASRIRYKRQL